MTYELMIGQRSYSSWSLRGWLPFAVWDIPVTLRHVVFYTDGFAEKVSAFSGGSTVPAAKTPDGGVLSDSLAIAWHLAEAFPEKGLLPEAPGARAEAMSLVAEMHSGFAALRGACPMNFRTAWDGFVPDASVRADLARLEALWTHALDGSGGPFLFGAYSLADVFFTPVAARIAGYGLPVTAEARAYADRLLALPEVQDWRDAGLATDTEVPQYEIGLPRLPFPMPERGAPVNHS